MNAEPAGGVGPAPDPEEGDLLRQLQRGGTEGLARLIDRYGESLMQYLNSILRDRGSAEEAFQETWIQVVRKIHRCDADRPFGPWLFRIARNRAFDELRRRRRWKLLSLDGRILRVHPQPPSAPSPLEQWAASDLAAKLLSRLEPAHREVIWLRFYRDCSYGEIAEICAIPAGTVKSRLRRALDRLGRVHAQMESGDENGQR